MPNIFHNSLSLGYPVAAGGGYPTSGLLARWALEDNLKDSYGSYNLSVSGTEAYTTGKVGKAFNNNNSGFPYINDASLYSSAWAGTHAFTMSAWFKTTANGDSILVSRGANNFKYMIIMATYGSGIDSKFYIARLWMGIQQNAIEVNVPYLDDGNWHFGVYRYSGSILDGFIDGDFTTTLSTSMSMNESEFRIGGANSSGVSGIWNGAIDQVYIYNRALTNEEIEQLYNNGSGV